MVTKRSRLTVLFGAGATTGSVLAAFKPPRATLAEMKRSHTPFNPSLPTTQHLSEQLLRKISVSAHLSGVAYNPGVRQSASGASQSQFLQGWEDVLVYQWIHHALQSWYRNPSFEDVLAAVEQLEGFASMQHTPGGRDDFKHPLLAFLDAKPSHAFLMDASLMREVRKQAYLTLMGETATLSNYPKAIKAYKRFLCGLSKRFELSIFTLNYDDIVDKALGSSAFDGYCRQVQVSGPTRWSFDENTFVSKYATSPLMLAHLHGSVCFGQSLPNEGRGMLKFLSSSAAIDQTQSISSSTQLQGGQMASSGPIISGSGKLMKLTENTAPYAYYYHAFCEHLLRFPRLLVIGYGGADPHLNAWLNEYAKLHGAKRRVAVIQKCTASDIRFESTPVTDTLHTLCQGRNLDDTQIESAETQFLSFTEQFALDLRGFPLQKRALRPLVEFLNSISTG